MKLGKHFKKSHDFLGEAGYSLIAGTVCPFGLIFMMAEKPIIAASLLTISLAAAWGGDKHMQANKAAASSNKPKL